MMTLEEVKSFLESNYVVAEGWDEDDEVTFIDTILEGGGFTVGGKKIELISEKRKNSDYEVIFSIEGEGTFRIWGYYCSYGGVSLDDAMDSLHRVEHKEVKIKKWVEVK